MSPQKNKNAETEIKRSKERKIKVFKKQDEQGRL